MPNRDIRAIACIAQVISAYNRKRKHALLTEAISVNGSGLILDAGFADREYSPSDNYLERHHSDRRCIVGLSLEHGSSFRDRYPGVMAVQYAGGPFPFRDKAFSMCWSNAVIEHVGGWNQQVAYLKEMLRVARSVVFTTPNRRFPVEVHTRTPLLHLGPPWIFDAYLRAIGKGWACGDYMRLLSESDLRRMLAEVGRPDARIIRNRLAGFAMDFMIIVDRQ